ncbi:MAG TPA: DNA methyltransferase [Allosphingosinicella sp.]|jgi:hypothetical protein
MNAVEIEEAVSHFVAEPFDPAEFPYQFITAFSAKKTTVDRLRKGDSNQSDAGGVLQRNNIHIAVAPVGEVHDKLAALRASPKTASQKAKFILATDGETVEAEDLIGGDVIACAYADLPRYFATFLPLAGISTVKEIKNNPIDVKATGRLNKLYVTLLSDNPDWATEERRHALNQFMARLIFCYFAEDTGIFNGEGLFTSTVAKMSEAGHGSGDTQWGNTHEVLQHLFLAMETPVKHEGNFDDRYRRAAGIRPYADIFPYVNGGLFTAADECPRFSRTARAYLLSAGELDWKEINPDIFGSMIQAVADDGERGELGMHYTSVPNILKVLNPLFLEDLREQLEAAGDSRQKLRNLRKHLANIRVFDPACGSGNFLVIAYKQMRAIEAGIVERLGGETSLKLDERRSVIPLSNFYGIEIKSFAAEIARLALLIAEFQADCLYLSQQEARAMVLPLHKTGQITVGNALRKEWLEVCPPVRVATGAEHDLGGPTGRLALDEDRLAGGAEVETYICGNPPYVGSKWQTEAQRADIEAIFASRSKNYRTLDYVAGWFLKAADHVANSAGAAAFVSTNSIAQGEQVAQLWPLIFKQDIHVRFAHQSFKWQNLAAHNAGVTVVIVGIAPRSFVGTPTLFEGASARTVSCISPYLFAGDEAIVEKRGQPFNGRATMQFGNHPYYATDLMLSTDDAATLVEEVPAVISFLRPLYGSQEFINGAPRRCIWVPDEEAGEAASIPQIAALFERVRAKRQAATADKTAQELARRPYRFRDQATANQSTLIVPRVTSERRQYLPVGLLPADAIVQDRAFALYDAPLWNMALIASRLHWVWIGTVCVRMRTDFSYSNTLGWNTFPVPKLTELDKADLTRTAENILLAREAHFPATIADLYDPEAMPEDLRRAHDENDEVLERVYIGRRFRNDTERLEKLFELYTKMTAGAPKEKKGKQAA